MPARTPLGKSWEGKLAHLAKTKAEKKADSSPVKGSSQAYPWGTQVDLDEASHKKLGIKGAMNAGDEYMITARGRVSSSSNNDRDGEGSSRSASIQITHMALAPKTAQKKAVRATPTKVTGDDDAADR